MFIADAVDADKKKVFLYKIILWGRNSSQIDRNNSVC